MLSNSVKERYIMAGYGFTMLGKKIMENGKELSQKALNDDSLVKLDAICQTNMNMAKELIDLSCNAKKSRFKVALDVVMWLLLTILGCVTIAAAPDKASTVVTTFFTTTSIGFLMASFDVYMKRDE